MAKHGSAEIAALLRRRITDGELAYGERLPPTRDMSDSFGVARNTVREALKRLENERLLSIRAGSGAYVTHRRDETSTDAIDRASPLELIDARFALEPHICRLCVLHGRREDFERLGHLCDRMEAAVDDPAEFSDADAEFHRALAETTRNVLLTWVIRHVGEVRGRDEWVRMRHLTLNRDIITEYNTQHRQILNAIRSREPERAANLMKNHLETARVSLMRAADA